MGARTQGKERFAMASLAPPKDQFGEQPADEEPAERDAREIEDATDDVPHQQTASTGVSGTIIL